MKVVAWLVKSGILEYRDRELYQYACYSFVIQSIPFFLASAISILINGTIQGMVIVIPFVILRKYAGGFHAKKLSTCMGMSSLILYVSMKISMIIQNTSFPVICAILALVSLCIFSPIENKNKPLEVYEKRLYRQRVFKYSAILGIVDIILCFMEIQSMAVLFSNGILLAAGLQIPCVLKGDMEHGYGLEK